MPDGGFWWAAGSLPGALLLRSRTLTLIALALASLWFGLRYSLEYFEWGLAVFLAGALYVLVCGRTSLLLCLAFTAMAFIWIEAALGPLWADPVHGPDLTAENVFAGAALAVLVYAAAHRLGARQRAQGQGLRGHSLPGRFTAGPWRDSS